MLFSRYKADFLRFFPRKSSKLRFDLMYELQSTAPSERRKSHFRGPRFQNFLPRTPLQVRGLVHQSTKPLDPPLV
jgi:hypothetical protein